MNLRSSDTRSQAGPVTVHTRQREPRAVELFKLLVWAREQNQIAEGREMISQLYREGWAVTPIAPKRGRGAAR